MNLCLNLNLQPVESDIPGKTENCRSGKKSRYMSEKKFTALSKILLNILNLKINCKKSSNNLAL